MLAPKKLETTGTGIAVPNISVSGVGTFSTRIDTNGVSLGTNNNNFAAKFIDGAVAEGKNVLIHCQAGTHQIRSQNKIEI